eukprot:1143495-Pelagomonas_calceolata.AAC.4
MTTAAEKSKDGMCQEHDDVLVPKTERFHTHPGHPSTNPRKGNWRRKGCLLLLYKQVILMDCLVNMNVLNTDGWMMNGWLNDVLVTILAENNLPNSLYIHIKFLLRHTHVAIVKNEVVSEFTDLHDDLQLLP